MLDGQPRLKGLINDIPKCISDIEEYNVRNSAELAPCHFGGKAKTLSPWEFTGLSRITLYHKLLRWLVVMGMCINVPTKHILFWNPQCWTLGDLPGESQTGRRWFYGEGSWKVGDTSVSTWPRSNFLLYWGWKINCQNGRCWLQGREASCVAGKGAQQIQQKEEAGTSWGRKLWLRCTWWDPWFREPLSHVLCTCSSSYSLFS